MVKAILTKPLDGMPEGSEREFDRDDFVRLAAMGAVRAASDQEQKAAPPVANKMAPAPENKGAPPADVTVAPVRRPRRGN